MKPLAAKGSILESGEKEELEHSFDDYGLSVTVRLEDGFGIPYVPVDGKLAQFVPSEDAAPLINVLCREILRMVETLESEKMAKKQLLQVVADMEGKRRKRR